MGSGAAPRFIPSESPAKPKHLRSDIQGSLGDILKIHRCTFYSLARGLDRKLEPLHSGASIVSSRVNPYPFPLCLQLNGCSRVGCIRGKEIGVPFVLAYSCAFCFMSEFIYLSHLAQMKGQKVTGRHLPSPLCGPGLCHVLSVPCPHPGAWDYLAVVPPVFPFSALLPTL